MEWKYARSQLYMQYIQEGSTLPVPYNIIPSSKSIMRLLAAVCGIICQAVACCKWRKDINSGVGKNTDMVKHMNT